MDKAAHGPDEFFTQLLLFALDGLVQLFEATLAQLVSGQYQPYMSPARANAIYTLGPRAALWHRAG